MPLLVLTYIKVMSINFIAVSWILEFIGFLPSSQNNCSKP